MQKLFIKKDLDHTKNVNCETDACENEPPYHNYSDLPSFGGTKFSELFISSLILLPPPQGEGSNACMRGGPVPAVSHRYLSFGGPPHSPHFQTDTPMPGQENRVNKDKDMDLGLNLGRNSRMFQPQVGPHVFDLIPGQTA